MAGAEADGPMGEAVAEREDREQADLEALRVTREESRVVLDHQVALLNEIDDRAVRTVRLAGVTLGIVVSVLGLAGPSLLSGAGTTVLLLVSLGVCSLLVCVLVGIGTYSTSGASFGIDESFRREILAGTYAEREWLRELLAAYNGWSDEMQQVIERDGMYLLVTQLLLLAGIAFLATAIALTATASYL